MPNYAETSLPLWHISLTDFVFTQNKKKKKIAIAFGLLETIFIIFIYLY